MPEMIENRMVVDSEWESLEKEKLNGAGYYNPISGVFVPKDSALEYMIETVLGDQDEADDLIEHFYKDWIKED